MVIYYIHWIIILVEKESEYGRLKFESEYINGERNGKGKEYNWQGLLLFEGEYLNDKEWKGIRLDAFNNIVYELKDRKRTNKRTWW